jgi:hypothetical protein
MLVQRAKQRTRDFGSLLAEALRAIRDALTTWVDERKVALRFAAETHAREALPDGDVKC